MEDVMELFFELLYAGFKKCGHKVMPERLWNWLERQSRSQRKAIRELFHVAAFTVAVGIAFLISLGLMIVGMYIAERIGIEL